MFHFPVARFSPYSILFGGHLVLPNWGMKVIISWLVRSQEKKLAQKVGPLSIVQRLCEERTDCRNWISSFTSKSDFLKYFCSCSKGYFFFHSSDTPPPPKKKEKKSRLGFASQLGVYVSSVVSFWHFLMNPSIKRKKKKRVREDRLFLTLLFGLQNRCWSC